MPVNWRTREVPNQAPAAAAESSNGTVWLGRLEQESKPIAQRHRKPRRFGRHPTSDRELSRRQRWRTQDTPLPRLVESSPGQRGPGPRRFRSLPLSTFPPPEASAQQPEGLTQTETLPGSTARLPSRRQAETRRREVWSINRSHRQGSAGTGVKDQLKL